jgi:hypothetical protein
MQVESRGRKPVVIELLQPIAFCSDLAALAAHQDAA